MQWYCTKQCKFCRSVRQIAAGLYGLYIPEFTKLFFLPSLTLIYLCTHRLFLAFCFSWLLESGFLVLLSSLQPTARKYLRIKYKYEGTYIVLLWCLMYGGRGLKIPGRIYKTKGKLFPIHQLGTNCGIPIFWWNWKNFLKLMEYSVQCKPSTVLGCCSHFHLYQFHRTLL